MLGDIAFFENYILQNILIAEKGYWFMPSFFYFEQLKPFNFKNHKTLYILIFIIKNPESCQK